MFPETDFISPEHPANEDACKSIESHKRGVDGPFALDDTGV